MPRTYKKTGKPRGGQQGNQNGHKHGAHTLREKAEHLRAESALRAVRALNAAAQLEAGDADLDEETEDAETRAACEEVRARFARLKQEGNLRGVVVDLILERVAFTWLDLFPGHEQPDWVYAWANIQPNAHQSPPFEDWHDVAPGLPGRGDTPCENPNSNPPRVHTKTRIGDYLRGWPDHGKATMVGDAMVSDLLRSHPEFETPERARAMLDWALRNGLLGPR